MPSVYLARAAACAVVLSSSAFAAISAPVPGVYQFTGVVSSSTARGTSACPAAKTPVSGEIVVTKGVNGLGAHFLTSAATPGWGFSIKPSNDDPAVQYGATTTGSMDYEISPSAQILSGTYRMRAVAGASASTFSLVLATQTGPLDASQTGSCSLVFNLTLKAGLPPRITNFLKGVL